MNPIRSQHKNRHVIAGAVAGLILACPGLLPAQQAPGNTPGTRSSSVTTISAIPATHPTTSSNGHITTQPGGKLLINFKDASIDSVLDELSAVAGFIVVKQTPTPLQGRITLISKQPITADEAIPLLNTVLKNAGYAAIQQGRVLKIYPASQARKANIPVHVGSDPTKIADTDELITQVIPLKQADAMQLKNDLTPLIDTTQADFTANASSNALVLTDTSANVKRVVEIVSALDQSLIGSAEVKVFQLQYASASAAAKLISDLFGETSQSRGRSSQDQSSRFSFFSRFSRDRGGAPGGNSSSGSSRQPVAVHASSDDRTNTVVVTGPPETLAVIEKVVKELDSNPLAEDTVFIYHLKNADALNVQQVMNYLFNSNGASGVPGNVTSNRSNAFNTNRVGGSSGFGSSGSSRGGFGGSSSSSMFGGSSFGSSGFGSSRSGSFGSSGSSGRSSFGGSSRSGFGGMGGSSQNGAAGAGTEVTVIADPDTNSLLVRTGPKNYEQVKAILDDLDRPVAQVLIKVLVAEVTHDRSFDVGAEWSILNLRSNGMGTKGGTDLGLKTLTGGLVVQTLEENIQATLRLLETEGKLDVLSRPYILASDNQLASITVGQEVPVIQNSRITDTGQTINTLQYQDVGILLDVVPHINTDGLVILDVAPEISSLTGQTVPISDTAAQPIIAKRSAQSRVGVMNGQTIVIGGLMEDKKTDTIQKVPLLGDIPWLGQAFRRTQTDKTKTELLIFLTPHVAARPEILQNMSQDEMGGMKLTPGAVGPGVFDEQMRGMQRGRTAPPGGSTTQPASTSMPSAVDLNAVPHPIRGGFNTGGNSDQQRRRENGESAGPESGEGGRGESAPGESAPPPPPAPSQGGSGGSD
jgi:general secretion pathway protein D